MKVVLELQDQPANVRRVMVRHDIVIGRGSDCNLRLSAPQVSRRHCFLRVGREGVSVTDLDSSNGTFVDGKRIKSGKRYELANGSSLSLGPIRFLIHIREEVVSADLLNSPNLDKSSEVAEANTQSTENSTTVESASSFVNGGRNAATQSLDMSIEQAGISAEAHESTVKAQKETANSGTSHGRGRIAPPELMDSRAEIIDLGRQIAELENAAAGSGPAKLNDDSLQQGASFSDELPGDDADLVEALDDGDDKSADSSFFAADENDDVTEAVVARHSGDPEEFVIDEEVENVVELPDDEIPGSESSDGANWSDLIPGTGDSVEAAAREVPEFSEAVDPRVDAEPATDPGVMADSGVPPVAEVEVVEEIEELETDDILLTEEIEEFVDVEEIADPELAISTDADGTDADVIETVPEDPETDGDGTWFDGEFKDNDDIDPDLQTFLKGF